MTVFWTSSSFNYYLITFFLKYIPGNIFVNTSLSAIAEISAYICSSFLMKAVGPKISFMCSFALGAVGGILLALFFYSTDVVIAVCVLFAKFGISFAFNISYLATPQMFPVELCGTAFGVCNVFARFSTVLSPLVAELPGVLPMTILAISCLASALLPVCLIIPKTDEEEVKDKDNEKE